MSSIVEVEIEIPVTIKVKVRAVRRTVLVDGVACDAGWETMHVMPQPADYAEVESAWFGHLNRDGGEQDAFDNACFKAAGLKWNPATFTYEKVG